MRVVAGKYRHINLNTLDSLDTRPTKDMVKEALFSSLGNIEDSRFLDLFSGSGAIGIEALSRGAKEVIFNDVNKKAVKVIKDNLIKVKEERTVYSLNYEECLLKLHGQKFDYIFLDPPYIFNDFSKIFEMIQKNELLAQNGTIIFEIRKDTIMENEYSKIVLYKEKKYGISKLMYYKEKIND